MKIYANMYINNGNLNLTKFYQGNFKQYLKCGYFSDDGRSMSQNLWTLNRQAEIFLHNVKKPRMFVLFNILSTHM